MRSVGRILLPLVGLPLLCLTLAHSQQRTVEIKEGVVTGSLMELGARRHVLLLVRRSTVIDSREQAESILREVYTTDAGTPQRFARVYNAIAGRLNKYMSKYHSISAARNMSEADFIVFFNLLEYRRSLGYPYPYGEMFIILNEKSGSRQPHIIWRTRKNPVWAEDAINDFIKELKAIRGEG